MNHPSRFRRRLATVVLTSTALLAATVAMQPALADPHASHPGIVSANPADNTPDVLDGHVDAIVQVGSTVVVGGHFSQVGRAGVTFTRHNLFAYDATTGEVSTTFKPRAFGEVHDLLVSPDKKSVYAVGDFTSVNRHTGTNRAVRLRLPNGAVDRRFRSPGFDRSVNDAVWAKRRLYLAGDFTQVGARHRGYLVALARSGRDTGRASIRLSGTNRNGRTHITSMDLAPGGSTMVIAGNFMMVDGRRRAQLAVLNVGKKATTLSSWATTRYAPRCGAHFDSYMRDVAFSPGGRYFVVATTGGPKGVQSSGLLCDSVSRWNLGTGAGKQPAWVDYTGGDTLTAVIVDSNVVYVGGHQRWFNNSYGHNDAGAGAVDRPGIAALDPVNGLPYSWNPGRPRGVGVSGFALVKKGLYVGHDTSSFADEPHQRLAFLPIDHATTLPAYHTASLPGTLVLLGKGGSDAAVGSWFNGSSSTGSHSITTSQTWQDSRGAFVVDGILYAGWSDGTMTEQTFDATGFGTPTTLDLHGAFTDVPKATSMFFDRTTHRLYYSLDGSSKLFYRYFQPESGIVGSWQFRARSPGLVDWSRVSGAFVVKRTLYYVDSPTGTLRTVRWSTTKQHPIGKVTTLLGPKIDHVSYRSRSLVLTD